MLCNNPTAPISPQDYFDDCTKKSFSIPSSTPLFSRAIPKASDQQAQPVVQKPKVTVPETLPADSRRTAEKVVLVILGLILCVAAPILLSTFMPAFLLLLTIFLCVLSISIGLGLLVLALTPPEQMERWHPLGFKLPPNHH